jgi:signal transduction histidine kinase
MTSLGLLVSGVAHEINNPNNFIMANSRLLERSWADALNILREYHRENGEFFIGGVPFSELDAHSPNLFAGIIDGARRIESIVNNLKGFARNDSSIESSGINVNQVASAAISILHYELNKFTDNFHAELAEGIPVIKGSSQQLGQVIINLLMNACQSLPDRRSGIWLSTGFDTGKQQVTISVRDEGHGMSPEKSSMIMEPFFTTKLDSGGTGLGLSICQSIVKDHSWSMDFTSEQGKGSTFVVRIPLPATA